MKKSLLQLFTVCFMLAALLFGCFGSFLFYAVSDAGNRSDVRSSMLNRSEENLLQLTIPSNDLADETVFQQLEENEINYKGHLYDVARQHATPGGMVFYCIRDSKEENLNASLNEHVKTLFDHTPGKTGSKTFPGKTLRDYTGIPLFNFRPLNKSVSFYFCSFLTPACEAVYRDIYIPPPALA